MEILLILAAAIGLYVFMKAAGRSSQSISRRTASEPSLEVTVTTRYEEGDYRLTSSVWNANKDWLKARWEEAEQARETGEKSDLFPSWWFDEVTERQLDRLRRMGITTKPITKGQASDLIGLMEEPNDFDLEVLDFFKVPTRGMNQTRARAEVATIFRAPENKKRWENREATAEQKECLRFLGKKVPKCLTHEEAARLIAELGEEHPDLAEDWDNFQSIIAEFDDKDARELMGVKKPSGKVLRECIDQLRAKGHALQQLADDPEIVAEKLIELHPELERPMDE